MQIRDDRIIRRLFEEVTKCVFGHGCNLGFNFVKKDRQVLHDWGGGGESGGLVVSVVDSTL